MRLYIQVFRMLSLSLYATLRLRVNPRELLRQLFEIGNRSLLFVGVTMAFIGMIGVYQIASTMARVLPEFSLLGAAVLQGLTKELAPVMAGLLLATRAGTGMAAELGSMRVTDQLEAMKLSSVDPIELLVAPRLLASTIVCLGLAAIGGVIAYLAGLAVAHYGFDILPDTYLSLRFIRTPDLTMGIAKSLLFGFTVPLVSCACGFEATGGAEGVGTATTRAVVHSSFAVILLDATVSWLGEAL